MTKLVLSVFRYRAWWLDAIPMGASDRSISAPNAPVCRIWGDRWDSGLVKPKSPRPHPPSPPGPHPGPAPPPGPGPEPGDVITAHCDGSDTNQRPTLFGLLSDEVKKLELPSEESCERHKGCEGGCTPCLIEWTRIGVT